MEKISLKTLSEIEGGGFLLGLLLAIALEVIDNPDDFKRGYRAGYNSI